MPRDGIPALMWLVSGMPALADIPVGRLYLSALIALAGLSLSVWSIVYMKRLEADFGEEYLEYKKCTGRFITLKK